MASKAGRWKTDSNRQLSARPDLVMGREFWRGVDKQKSGQRNRQPLLKFTQQYG
jgi:hypothetical protein